jgi:hypothetical protein
MFVILRRSRKAAQSKDLRFLPSKPPRLTILPRALRKDGWIKSPVSI